MSSRAALKAFFETGDVPTEVQFANLIDSLAHVSEDGLLQSQKFPIVTDATAARTLVLTDAQKYIRCTNAGAMAVTIPPQSDVAWPADTEIIVEQAGAGQVTIAAGVGVTIRNRADMTLKSAAQYAVLTLKRVGADEWVLSGDREAA
jgi:hypothetical protein